MPSAWWCTVTSIDEAARETVKDRRRLVEEAIGEALHTGADYVEVVTDFDRAGSGEPLATRQPDATLSIGLTVRVCGDESDLTPAVELPGLHHERVVYDLRPLRYADVKELHEAEREGDTERLTELSERLKATAEAMVGGPEAPARGPTGGGWR